jgi:hypothetical protein
MKRVISRRSNVSFLMTFLGLSILCMQCETKRISQLHGTWKLDSVYSFYNGFDMTSPGQEPLYHFQPDGRLRMSQDNEYRYFTYEIQNDSLLYQTLENKRIDGLLIVDLDDDQLILKKLKRPLFNSHNQERYEIKYFSKIK